MVKISQANVLTNKIIDFLYKQGIFCWRQNSGGVFDKRLGLYRAGAKRGVADILGCVPPSGQLIAVEVKIGKDKLSLEQEGFLENISSTGGNYYVAKDFESFKKWWLTQYPIEKLSTP